MTKMLGNLCPRGCPYGRDCCTQTRGKEGKAARRRTKRSERNKWKKEIND